jgi:hypothetical protein
VDALQTQNAPAEADADVTSAHTADDVKNLVIARVNNTDVDVNVDYVQVEGYNLSSVDLTIDITVSGANGLDTGSEAADTWYSIWVIYNPTIDTSAGLLSTSVTSPTMPSGYTKSRRVGWVKNDSFSNFEPFHMVGNWWFWDYRRLILNTSSPATVWTDVDCSAMIPPTSQLATMWYNARDTNGAGAFIYLRRNGQGADYDLGAESGTATFDYIGGAVLLPCDENQIVEYKGDIGLNIAQLAVIAYHEPI